MHLGEAARVEQAVSGCIHQQEEASIMPTCISAELEQHLGRKHSSHEANQGQLSHSEPDWLGSCDAVNLEWQEPRLAGISWKVSGMKYIPRQPLPREVSKSFLREDMEPEKILVPSAGIPHLFQLSVWVKSLPRAI